MKRKAEGKRSCSRMFLITTIYLCSLIYLPLYAQTEFGGFENIGKTEGLYHLHTTSLKQDSKGFIWIGSTDGLMRYDGVLFDVFRRSKMDTTALSDNSITCIVEDLNEYVFWIGTVWGGINRFDIVKNNYVHYPLGESDEKKVTCLYQIDDDKFLVGTVSNGLFFFYPSTSKFESTGYTDKNSRIYDIIKGNENIWIIASEGAYCLKEKKDTLNSSGKPCCIDLYNQKNKPKKCYKKIRGIQELENGDILFLVGNSLYKYISAEKRKEIVFAVNKNVVFNKILLDHFGNYWVGSQKNGLFFYDLKKRTATNFRRDDKDVYNSLVNNEIKDLLLVRDQNILLVATKKGISKYDYNKRVFKKYNVNDLSDSRLNEVSLIFKDFSGGYWLRNDSGNIFYSPQAKQRFKPFSREKNFYTYQILQTDTQNLWFVCNKGLYNYNFKSHKTKTIKFENDSFNQFKLNHLNAGIKYENNKFWLVSRSGLILYDYSNGGYQVYQKEFPKIKECSVCFVSLDYSHDNKYLWLAEKSGRLYKFHIPSKEFIKVEPNFDKVNFRNPKKFVDVEVDSQGKLWIATYGSGVLVYDPKTNTISDKFAVDELESYVYGIISDDNNNMWISSNFGITCINTIDNSVSFYGSQEGALTGEPNQRTYHKEENGNMLFGGQDGFVEFNTKDIYRNPYNKPPIIESWSKEDKTSGFINNLYDEVSYLTDSVIKFKSVKGNVKFYVSLLNYSHAEQNKIKWKLEGYDKKWFKGYTSEAISFNNLKPGKYVLRVKGINNHGIETNDEARLKVIVIPTFYESLFFKILVSVVILILMYLIFRVRIAWYRNQKEILVNTVNEKTKELTRTNEILEDTKEEILKQNAELHIHRNYLEDLVNIRTEDLKKAKLKAEESDRLKTAFLANLSHEIRTPMNAIIGFSSLMLKDEFPESQKVNFLKVIGQSSESLLSLIDDIIDISRIETGNLKINATNVNVKDLIQEIISELTFEDKSDSVSLNVNCELFDDNEYVFIDKQRLKQIISNLLRNAFKFTKEGYVKLVVKASTISELKDLGFSLDNIKEDTVKPVLFIVQDTGIGMESSDLGIIFQPFQKARKSKELFKGMGLGLSIVKNLVGLFGGDIIVYSQVNKGTKFYFYINSLPTFRS